MPVASPHSPRKRGEGTCSTRGELGTESLRHIPFAPQAGRRWRQPDEGLACPEATQRRLSIKKGRY
ncbi:hypothetical protein ELH27_03715 [Rhizobium leguminosarum]|uniref:Propionyl-coenzyme A carboxylase alpha polypeptide n=1 Tax=Rhizobium beringeri TaxID=3019934 RepID=A0ABY1XQW4_9HYPH|nr:hypothetical protein ELI43_03565 [Rhizobium leguminosarum]TBC72024.1 hypothetical protein ELH27_03715 [Rhizobium leguminosarum]TBD03567.1 hypothetical protein ELH21_03710 [Rhizobium leguminosarum]TBE69913.1 hypothetical protein ELH03_03595 [Rhizobium beringeri]